MGDVSHVTPFIHGWLIVSYDLLCQHATNYKSLLLAVTKIQKATQDIEMGWTGVARGYSKTLELAPFEPNSTLLAGPRTSCPTRVGQLVRELVRWLANF